MTFIGAALRLRTIHQTLDRIGRRLGVTIEAVDLSDPLAAVDVDKLADHGLVEQLLKERGAGQPFVSSEVETRASTTLGTNGEGQTNV
jgi:hypothetical protein